MSDRFIILEEWKELKPIECPQRGGINFPCVICRECEIGDVTTSFEEHLILESTVNSVLVHIDLGLKERNDDIEKFSLKRVKIGLSKAIPAIQRSDWEEGDITIMIDDEMAKDPVTLQKIHYFINTFHREWPRFASQAKQAFTKWETQLVREIKFDYDNKFNEKI